MRTSADERGVPAATTIHSELMRSSATALLIDVARRVAQREVRQWPPRARLRDADGLGLKLQCRREPAPSLVALDQLDNRIGERVVTPPVLDDEQAARPDVREQALERRSRTREQMRRVVDHEVDQGLPELGGHVSGQGAHRTGRLRNEVRTRSPAPLCSRNRSSTFTGCGSISIAISYRRRFGELVQKRRAASAADAAPRMETAWGCSAGAQRMYCSPTLAAASTSSGSGRRGAPAEEPAMEVPARPHEAVQLEELDRQLGIGDLVVHEPGPGEWMAGQDGSRVAKRPARSARADRATRLRETLGVMPAAVTGAPSVRSGSSESPTPRPPGPASIASSKRNPSGPTGSRAEAPSSTRSSRPPPRRTRCSWPGSPPIVRRGRPRRRSVGARRDALATESDYHLLFASVPAADDPPAELRRRKRRALTSIWTMPPETSEPRSESISKPAGKLTKEFAPALIYGFSRSAIDPC